MRKIIDVGVVQTTPMLPCRWVKWDKDVVDQDKEYQELPLGTRFELVAYVKPQVIRPQDAKWVKSLVYRILESWFLVVGNQSPAFVRWCTEKENQYRWTISHEDLDDITGISQGFEMAKCAAERAMAERGWHGFRLETGDENEKIS